MKFTVTESMASQAHKLYCVDLFVMQLRLFFIPAVHEKNSALIASQIARHDDILHFHAIRAIAAIAPKRTKSPLLLFHVLTKKNEAESDLGPS